MQDSQAEQRERGGAGEVRGEAVATAQGSPSAVPIDARGWGSFATQDVEVLVRRAERDDPWPAGTEAIVRELNEHVKREERDKKWAAAPSPLFTSALSLSLSPLAPPLPRALLDSRYGAHLASTLFCLDTSSFTFINHGAFGAAFRPAMHAQHRWAMHLESQPLRFIDRQLLPTLVHVVRQLAAFIGADPLRLVPLHNVTTGLTQIVRSLAAYKPTSAMTTPAAASTTTMPLPPLGPECAILRLSVCYGAVKKMTSWLAAETGATLVEVHIPLPIDNSTTLVALVERAMRANPSVAVVFLDHVTSNSALVLPLDALIAMCRRVAERRDLVIVVDGAHGPAAIARAVTSFDADFYVGNCHKWMCNPKGAAFMHVSERVVVASRVAPTSAAAAAAAAATTPTAPFRLVPPTISHGYGSGMLSEFVWTGCWDYASWLALLTTMHVWQRLDLNASRRYAHALVVWAARMLAAVWRTDCVVGSVTGDDDDDRADNVSERGDLTFAGMLGWMACVRLPGALLEQHPDEHNVIQDRLHFECAIEAPIKVLDGRLYVRISAHVYNEPRDYVRLAEAMLRIRPVLEE